MLFQTSHFCFFFDVQLSFSSRQVSYHFMKIAEDVNIK